MQRKKNKNKNRTTTTSSSKKQREKSLPDQCEPNWKLLIACCFSIPGSKTADARFFTFSFCSSFLCDFQAKFTTRKLQSKKKKLHKSSLSLCLSQTNTSCSKRDGERSERESKRAAGKCKARISLPSVTPSRYDIPPQTSPFCTLTAY